MAKQSKSKRARQRRERRGNVRLRALGLEVTLGYDGFLRGRPEPAIVVAGYWLPAARADAAPTTPRCLGCHVSRYRLPENPPVWIPPHLAQQLTMTRLPVSPKASSLALVAVAMEEDSGEGIGRVVDALQQPEGLSFWRDDEVIPDPHALEDATQVSGADTAPTAVRLLLEGQDLALTVAGDDYVGACLWVSKATTRREILDFRFRSADEQNVWALRLNLHMERP